MPPERALLPSASGTVLDHLALHWRAPLIRLGLAWAVLFALTWRDWSAMFGLWWNVSTYNHILFVPIIIGWLVWHRRSELARLEPEGWWPGLVLVAGALLVWLVARLGGLDIGSQLGAVAAMQCAVVAVLGPRAAAGLLFPLGYALFLVPFGDELVPALQMITARMTIALTLWSGVPAVVDGVFIDTPAGLFEVAEECSGVKFLIAMIALGVLVAQCCFTSWTRRALFMALAIALPILANGVRAWSTIYIAQSQGIEFAAGFDHIVYGWVFFGVVIAMLLGSAWRWFDRDPDDQQIDAAAIAASPLLDRLRVAAIDGRRVLLAIAGITLLAGAWQAGAAQLRADLPAAITAPEVQGWRLVQPGNRLGWEPRASGADRRLLVQYRDGQGRTVDVFLALYAVQNDHADATGFGEGALPPDTDWRWLAPAPAPVDMKGDALFAQGTIKRVAWTQWRSGDLATARPSRLKLAVMRDRAFLSVRPVATLIVSADGSDTDEIGMRLNDFARAMGSPTGWIDRAVPND
jgi:exosortase A